MNIKELFEAKNKLQSFAKDTFNVTFIFKVIITHKNNNHRYTERMINYSMLTTSYHNIITELELSERDNDLGYGKEYIYEDDTHEMRFTLSLD